jgi:hypothetical protein
MNKSGIVKRMLFMNVTGPNMNQVNEEKCESWQIKDVGAG